MGASDCPYFALRTRLFGYLAGVVQDVPKEQALRPEDEAFIQPEEPNRWFLIVIPSYYLNESTPLEDDCKT